jgi:hypothetical protein
MITSRQGLIDYALRKLGAPVIEINIDVSQVEDRVDEALQFFQDFHYDATERLYLKHQITGTIITVSDATNFTVGENVVCSNGTTFAIDSKTPTTLITKNCYNAQGIDKQPVPALSTIIGQTSGATATVVSKVAGDTENGFVTVGEMVTGVTRVLPWSGATSKTNYYFDPKYQTIISSFANISSTSMIYFEQLQSHIALLDQLLKPIESISFNQKMNSVRIDMDWSEATIGAFLIFDCFRILDPEVFTKIYNDRMLKKLVTAKIKYQWASNTQKYQGIQLLGGVTIDASTLMAQAVAEIEAAEAEIRDSYEIPPIGFIA